MLAGNGPVSCPGAALVHKNFSFPCDSGYAPDTLDLLADSSRRFHDEFSMLFGCCAEQAQYTLSLGRTPAEQRQIGRGFPANMEYRWIEDDGRPAMDLSSVDYCLRVFEWVEGALNDPLLFPVEESRVFGSNFLPTVRRVFTRLFRVCAIMHGTRIETILRSQGVEERFRRSFEEFVLFAYEHDLIREKELSALPNETRALKIESKRQQEAARTSGLRRSSGLVNFARRRARAKATKANAKAASKDADKESHGKRKLHGYATATARAEAHSLKSENTDLNSSSQTKAEQEKRNNKARRDGRRRLSYLETMSTALDTMTIDHMMADVVRRESSSGGKKLVQACMDAVKRILDSEVEFGDLVVKLRDEYMVPLARSAQLSDEELEVMFGNLLEILDFSESICAEMHTCLRGLVVSDRHRRVSSTVTSRKAKASSFGGHGSAGGKKAVPGCRKVVTTLIHEAVLPSLGFFPQVFARFVAGFSKSIERINHAVSSNHLFARVVQSKNATLETSLPDLLEIVLDRPAHFASNLVDLHRAVIAYCGSHRKQKSHSSTTSFEDGRTERAKGTKKHLLTYMLPDRLSFSARSYKKVGKLVANTAELAVMQVKRVNAGAQAIADERAVERLLCASNASYSTGDLVDGEQCGESVVASGACSYRVSSSEKRNDQARGQAGSRSNGTAYVSSGGSLLLVQRAPMVDRKDFLSPDSEESRLFSGGKTTATARRMLRLRRFRRKKKFAFASPASMEKNIVLLPAQNALKVRLVLTGLKLPERCRKGAAKDDQDRVFSLTVIGKNESDGTGKSQLSLQLDGFELALAVLDAAGASVPQQLLKTNLPSTPLFRAASNTASVFGFQNYTNSPKNRAAKSISATMSSWSSESSGGSATTAETASLSSNSPRNSEVGQETETKSMVPENNKVVVVHHPADISTTWAIKAHFDLRARGLKPWMQSLKGCGLKTSLEDTARAVQNAAAILLILTPGCTVNPIVVRQIELAHKFQVPLHVLVVDELFESRQVDDLFNEAVEFAAKALPKSLRPSVRAAHIHHVKHNSIEWKINGETVVCAARSAIPSNDQHGLRAPVMSA